MTIDTIMRLILVMACGGVLYTLLILVRPLHRCWHCHGTGVIPGRRGARACSRCRGTRKTRWPLATAAHQLFWEYAGPWARDRFRDTVTRLRDGS